MSLLDTFILSKSGLFDFDLTFFTETAEFIFLSFIVTFFFISPISKQLDERAEFINKNLRKSMFYITYSYEKIIFSVGLLTSEITELTRQVKLLKTYSYENLENEVFIVQQEIGKLLSKLKGDLSIQSAYLFSNLLNEVVSLSDMFYSKKFKI
jgi:hypothetical protein